MEFCLQQFSSECQRERSCYWNARETMHFLLIIVFMKVSIPFCLSIGTLEFEILNGVSVGEKLLICLKEKYSRVLHEPCTFGQSWTEVQNIPQNVVIGVSFRWTGALTIVLLGDNWTHVLYDNELLPNKHNWKYKTFDNRLLIRYRFSCNQYYHAADCATFCRPRDDIYGHYHCDGNGNKVCLVGWKGVNCDQPQCKKGCNENHGFCVEPEECLCRNGWTGRNCSECQQYPGCMHGYCLLPWQCICHRNWGGILCDQDLDYCHTHKPCVANQGICENIQPNDYRCVCKKGFDGKNCEKVMDACALHPCLNDGTCVSTIDSIGYRCECRPGFDGTRCENNVNECVVNKCKNNATCIDLVNEYRCVCPSGWTGTNCDVDIDECQQYAPCIHSKQCINENGSYQCICNNGFDGKNCEVNINDCIDIDCGNGYCIDSIGRYQCICEHGFAGSNCNILDEAICNTSDNFVWLRKSDCQQVCLCKDNAIECKCIDKHLSSPQKCEHNQREQMHVTFDSPVKDACAKLYAISDILGANICCDKVLSNVISVTNVSPDMQTLVTKQLFSSLIEVKKVHTKENIYFYYIFVTFLAILLLVLLIFLIIYSTRRKHSNEPIRRVHNELNNKTINKQV